MVILPRRRFLQGLIGLVAAPAVVKADSLMKVFAPKPEWDVMDFGGSGPVNTSEWLVSWGSKKAFGVYPEEFDDLTFTSMPIADFRYANALTIAPR